MLFGGIAAALVGVIAAGVYLNLRPPQAADVPPTPPLKSAQSPTLTPADNAQKTGATVETFADGGKLDAGKATSGGGQTGTGNQIAGLIKPGLAAPSEIRPLPPAALPRDITRHIDEVTRYIRQYDGGDCFFLKPVAVNEMVTAIEGFGPSETPFRALNDAFRKNNGYEADIGMRQVDRRQCPAVTFLQHVRSAGASAPTIDLDTTSLKVGQNLSGTIKGADGRKIDLLVVADDGSLRTIETTPSRDNDGTLTFSQKIGPEFGNGQLQMVLAIASSKPLSVLRNARSTPADKLFPVVQAEADRTNQSLSASARTFKVES
jgi:serine/threonine-protein kinase